MIESRNMRVGGRGALLLAVSLAGCGRRESSVPPNGAARAATPASASDSLRAKPESGSAPAHEGELAALRAFEDARRRQTDFAHQPSGDIALGANPYQVASLGD